MGKRKKKGRGQLHARGPSRSGEPRVGGAGAERVRTIEFDEERIACLDFWMCPICRTGTEGYRKGSQVTCGAKVCREEYRRRAVVARMRRWRAKRKGG